MAAGYVTMITAGRHARQGMLLYIELTGTIGSSDCPTVDPTTATVWSAHVIGADFTKLEGISRNTAVPAPLPAILIDVS